eukprot:1221908-Pyramimonas_sp.AAC.1
MEEQQVHATAVAVTGLDSLGAQLEVQNAQVEALEEKLKALERSEAAALDALEQVGRPIPKSPKA